MPDWTGVHIVLLPSLGSLQVSTLRTELESIHACVHGNDVPRSDPRQAGAAKFCVFFPSIHLSTYFFFLSSFIYRCVCLSLSFCSVRSKDSSPPPLPFSLTHPFLVFSFSSLFFFFPFLFFSFFFISRASGLPWDDRDSKGPLVAVIGSGRRDLPSWCTAVMEGQMLELLYENSKSAHKRKREPDQGTKGSFCVKCNYMYIFIQ